VNRRLRTARHLPAALAVAVAVEIGIRLLGLPSLARLAAVELHTTGTARPPRVPSSRLGPDDGARYRAAWWVLRWWPFGRSGQCLRMALTAGRLLRHRGPRLCLGVTRGDSGVGAHAWLMIDDMVFDPDAAGYVPLVRVAG
jgi:Transglutaminase-like superfamily